MNTNTAIKAYAIIITLIIILVMVWRAGYQSGKQDTVERVEGVLNHAPVQRSFDAMCTEFEGELK